MASRRDRGAAAAELAMVLPLLMLILFGIIDFGLLLKAQISVTEAAREGARAATIDTTRPNAAADRVALVDPAYKAVVTAACGSSPTAGSNATVVVTYTHKWVTPVGAFIALFGGGSLGSGVNVSSTGVMPCRA
ncbi:TadE/TadG family type IV pilus assembly protein [Catellatospora tritici]|uniref:TadE/TadG family type IV pilus assembly protein n=1 Tax=Catellatospora tritici TaxID=2851566 RepID=UPI001C2CFA19|nr:TadE/TadG family type IV pilus assembly protein [Catellatospora tritici]MBV1852177.1 pilus assembly protein [Catellatospora tritici]